MVDRSADRTREYGGDDERVHRYRDPRVPVPVVNLRMGAVYIAQRPEILSTILGSCVALCLYAPDKHMAGMNHYLLPSNPRGTGGGAGQKPDPRYGDEASLLLLNRMLGRGVGQDTLVAKVFGGGRVVQGSMAGVGQCNVDQALSFLDHHDIPLKAMDVGGSRGRRILFDSRSGKVYQTRLRNMLIPRTAEEEARISDAERKHPLADVRATDLLDGL